MQRLDPSLSLSRLLVAQGGHVAFDTRFHDGVNILAGSNGSGKSTVADLIFLALGGDAPHLKDEAAACDYVFAEVLLNGQVATLRRETSPRQRRPMAISWAPLDVARRDVVAGWEVFPFNSTPGKRSFSQVLLSALGIPEALKGDLSGMITMHQLLRLMYVDQEAPFSSIFRVDHFDSPITRSGVGDLSLGLYEPSLYSKRLELGERRKEYATVNTQFIGAREVLREAGEGLTSEMLKQSRAEASDDLRRKRERLRELEKAESADTEDLHAAIEARRSELRAMLAETRSEERQALDRLETLDYEIQDSVLFLESLQRRLEALDDAKETQDALGVAAFAFCPSCFAPLKEKEDGFCSLCGSAEGLESIARNVARLRHELRMQLSESTSLQEARREERTELVATLPGIQDARRRMQAEYDEAMSGVRSAYAEEIAQLNREIGYATRQLQDLDEKIRLAEAIETLAVRREELKAEISRLETQIADLAKTVGDRRGATEKLIGESAASILRRDVPTEYKFEIAERVTFDFGDDSLAVGGKTAFAASSSVLLKNAFHLALLLASMEDQSVRYPRFWLCDNIEDKGMQQVRSQNFQRIVVERSREATVSHQVIFTTSMLAPDLDDPAYVVGKFSREKKSLAVRSG